MLSNLIRRNGKRKGSHSKTTGPQCHQKSLSTPVSSQLASPLVFDINEESRTARRSPVVELNLSTSNEEWFPRELLRSRSGSPSCSRPSQGVVEIPNTLTQETRKNPSPVPSLSRSENGSPSLASRKKSIPAPIKIPDHQIPNVLIGQSSAPSGENSVGTSQPNARGAHVNLPSPSASDNLSSISGTTLARALIASSFVLSSVEHRNSRHRSGVARQDSATLPRSSFFLSDSVSLSSIPPVPPVPANLANTPLDPPHPSALKSGASTESEYPMSDACTASPEMPNQSTMSPRPTRTPETPLPTAPASTEAPPVTVSAAKSQRRMAAPSARTRVLKNGISDGPKTAPEVPLPMNVRQRTQDSSQEGPLLLSSEDHSLDEFDFLPPEAMVMVASPESDSSASYIAPATPPSKRGGSIRGQWKHRGTGLSLVRNCSKVSLSDGAFAFQQAHNIPSTSTSEHDYGELLNYDLTVSPGSSLSSSSASAGYQTFPETPVVFTPLWSSGYAFLARSDTQVLRKHLPRVRSIGRGRLPSTRRRVGNNDGVVGGSQSSSLPGQKIPSPRQTELNLPPSASTLVNNVTSIPEDETSTTNEVTARHSDDLPAVRPHPLTHTSSSSSYVLEEEALQALAKHSLPSLPSITIGDVDHSSDSTTFPVLDDRDLSAKSPTSTPLPEPNVSPFNSPGRSMAVSSSESLLQLPLPTTSSIISGPHLSKSLLSTPSPSLESSFLPSTSPSPSLNEPLPQAHSPRVCASSSVSPSDPVSDSPSPSFIPPPPYHTIVSERTTLQPSSTSTPALSRKPSTEPNYRRSRQPSSSSLASGTVRTRARSRPPLPVGPRKPSSTGQSIISLPGIHGRNASTSSFGSTDPAGSQAFPWRKLHSAVSKPPPKFQVPPSKWRGFTLEAAQWTFTSAELQEIVSQAIQQSSDGSALRFLKPDVLEGEITEEMQRLELQHLDVKSQYKSLVRKRWILMGALAGHVEGVEMNDVATAVRTVEELAEVSSALDGLADRMHDLVLKMAQLKSLRDVHNMSALAMALRKINGLLVRQTAEKERLQEQVDALHAERDEAWKQAEEIAQDYDALNDRMSECASGCGDARLNGDAASVASSKRSRRISAIRRSTLRQSQAGLRSRSRPRARRSSVATSTRPSSPALDNIPPVPRLPLGSSLGSSSLAVPTDMSYGPNSAFAYTPGTEAALALAEAQRDVYEMLGLSVPPSQASSRRRTMSSSAMSRPQSPRSRPVSESLGGHVRRVRSRPDWGLTTKSMILDDFHHVRPLAITRS